MRARKRVKPAMNEVLWGLASLTVAGVAITVIATPIVVGTSRAARAVMRRLTSQRRDEQSSIRGTTRDRTATARPAAAAVAVPAPSTYGALKMLQGLAAAAEEADGVAPLRDPDGAYRHGVTAPPVPYPMPASLVREIRGRALGALTPLERAVWQGHERRGVPAVVAAEWKAGPRLVPGRYPLLPDEAMLSRGQLADLLAAQGCPGWERSAVIAAHPLDPRSNAWN